ncbi:MAG: response regulator transcription factor [Bacteroidales bacterium]|nr:response regulator transcription factor [Bacteroidales bacterium]
MLTAIVIDDENKVRETLKQMLTIYCPNISIVGEADGVASGYSCICKLNPDVVFLDMQMNDGNGFDLLRRFNPITFQLIIVTAYQDYAVKAFKYSAVDYLLKPIDPTDLITAVEKISISYNQSETKAKFDALISNSTKPEAKNKKLVLKTVVGIHIVETDSIIRCESHNNTTEFIFTDTAPIRVSRTLKEYEDLLSDCGFIRCHQSHLINPIHIVKVIRYPAPTIRTTDGFSIPVAIRKKDLLKVIESKESI